MHDEGSASVEYHLHVDRGEPLCVALVLVGRALVGMTLCIRSGILHCAT